MDTPATLHTSADVSLRSRWDHALARFGYRRQRHSVEPGLYVIGNPGPESPVFVSANYTLSFDALRSSLAGIDGYLLVLDTRGVNVWCAAGKGTFGTEEIVSRIQSTGLANLVTHRDLIVPQLGAPGVSASEVSSKSGFNVVYGPVLARDIPEFLSVGEATPRMREVPFRLRARSVLILIDLGRMVVPAAVVSVVLWLIGLYPLWYNEFLAGILGGLILTPVFLPWIPSKDFTTKGWVVGLIAAFPILIAIATSSVDVWWIRLTQAFGVVLIAAPLSAFFGLNFTGSSTHASKSGVKREIARYIPILAWTFAIGLILRILGAVL